MQGNGPDSKDRSRLLLDFWPLIMFILVLLVFLLRISLQ